MLSAENILDLIDKQWANADDIRLIGKVGKNRAQSIKKEIVETIKKERNIENLSLPWGLVPMEEVIKYFHINISYLKKVSKQKVETPSTKSPHLDSNRMN